MHDMKNKIKAVKHRCK